jgi:hypothetical protein
MHNFNGQQLGWRHSFGMAGGTFADRTSAATFLEEKGQASFQKRQDLG